MTLDKWGMRVHEHYLRTRIGFEVEDAAKTQGIPSGDVGPTDLMRRYANLGWFRCEPIDRTPGMPTKHWRYYAIVPEDVNMGSGEPFLWVGRLGRVRSVFELGATL